MNSQTLEILKNHIGNTYEIVSIDGNSITLECKFHGKFKKRIDHILECDADKLCTKCNKEKLRLKRFEEFVNEAKLIHGGKYEYHFDKFVNKTEKTIITCPVHGDFVQRPLNHTCLKQGCPICANEKKKVSYKYTRDEIIELCKKTHGDKYVYDDIIFQGMKEKLLNIKCPKHGYFNQVAYDHIKGYGCEKCKFENQTMSKSQFIERAMGIHKGFYRYDYDKIIYVNNHIKVPITCPIHGEFWQTPAYHLLGGGCPICSTSKLEKEIMNLLTDNNINFIPHYHNDWLGHLELDFYLPKYNVAIECQGMQHFKPIEYFGGEETFDSLMERDKRKSKLCLEHNVKIFYYSNLGIKYPYEVYENKDNLLNEIKGIEK